MITEKLNPAEWSLLIYELEDAKENLESLIKEIVAGEIDEVDYQIQLGHIYVHLNRSWNSRRKIGEYSDQERKVFSDFPKDIELYG